MSVVIVDYGSGNLHSAAKAFERAPAEKAFDLAELYEEILADGQLAGMEMKQRFYEIGSPAGLEEAARFIASQGVANA